jgi:hypothetical protein
MTAYGDKVDQRTVEMIRQSGMKEIPPHLLSAMTVAGIAEHCNALMEEAKKVAD